MKNLLWVSYFFRQNFRVQGHQVTEIHGRAVSQAAACDGTLITTSATSQEVIPGTLPTF